jgi:hypothetical protein
VTVNPEVRETTVTWRSWSISHPLAAGVDATALEPFTFDRRAFVGALATPVRADRPVRVPRDLAKVRGGLMTGRISRRYSSTIVFEPSKPSGSSRSRMPTPVSVASSRSRRWISSLNGSSFEPRGERP